MTSRSCELVLHQPRNRLADREKVLRRGRYSPGPPGRPRKTPDIGRFAFVLDTCAQKNGLAPRQDRQSSKARTRKSKHSKVKIQEVRTEDDHTQSLRM